MNTETFKQYQRSLAYLKNRQSQELPKLSPKVLIGSDFTEEIQDIPITITLPVQESSKPKECKIYNSNCKPLF